MAISLTFDVTHITAPPGRPFLPVRLVNPANARSLQLWSLFDTGADSSVFDVEVARYLGYDLATAPTTPIRGVTGNEMAFVLPVLQQLDGVVALGNALFAPNMPSIVGRVPMMQAVKFAFRHAASQFYIATSP